MDAPSTPAQNTAATYACHNVANSTHEFGLRHLRAPVINLCLFGCGQTQANGFKNYRSRLKGYLVDKLNNTNSELYC